VIVGGDAPGPNGRRLGTPNELNDPHPAPQLQETAVSPADPLPRTGLFVVDQLRAEVGPGTTVGEAEVLSQRMLTAGDYTRGENGRWCVVWRTALTNRPRELTPAEVGGQIMLARMRPSAAEPLTAAELTETCQRLVALLDAGEAEAAAPRPPADLLTVEQSWAGRIMRSHQVWTDKDGRLWWRLATPDPILGRGQGRSIPAPPPTPGGWLRRRQPPADASVLDVAALVAWTTLHPSVVQVGESPDFEKVIEELRALVAPR